MVRLQKAMKPKAILGDQTFDHQLTHLRKMGCVTGFELHLILRPVKKIKHLEMQKSEKAAEFPQIRNHTQSEKFPSSLQAEQPPGLLRQAGGLFGAL